MFGGPLIRTFEYRQPRVHVNFGLEFSVNDQTMFGLCTDVSDGGIRATFAEAMPMGSTGSLLLRHPRRTFTLDAVVAHIEGDNVGLSFLCETTEDKATSEQFAVLAASPVRHW